MRDISRIGIRCPWNPKLLCVDNTLSPRVHTLILPIVSYICILGYPGEWRACNVYHDLSHHPSKKKRQASSKWSVIHINRFVKRIYTPYMVGGGVWRRSTEEILLSPFPSPLVCDGWVLFSVMVHAMEIWEGKVLQKTQWDTVDFTCLVKGCMVPTFLLQLL